jgi:hypothetical protein
VIFNNIFSTGIFFFNCSIPKCKPIELGEPLQIRIRTNSLNVEIILEFESGSFPDTSKVTIGTGTGKLRILNFRVVDPDILQSGSGSSILAQTGTEQNF